MKGEYDLAGKVIGMAMKVHSTLGPGFLESVYQKSLAQELTEAGVRFESEKPLNVLCHGILVGEFVADFPVENELIVESKALQNLVPTHEVQTANYLAVTGKDVGLLLNFGAERLEFKKKFKLPKAKIHSEHSVYFV